MEKVLRVYIDHVGNESDNNTGTFAKRLKDRIKTIKEDFIIETYEELEDKSEGGARETIQAIIRADIIIPIISADYLGFAPPVEHIFNDVIESKDKYLFPILYSNADWGAIGWIVKSKMVPEDNVPLIEQTENDADRIINSLVSKIFEIIKSSKGLASRKAELASKFETDTVVFISHDHDDGDFAELLKLKLERNGIMGWLDNERLKIGQDWRQEIDDGIVNSVAVIAIMTPEARKSEYVTYEWAFAWGKGKKIFPVMLKQTQLHPRLESLQYLDFTKRNSRPFEQLIESIKELI